MVSERAPASQTSAETATPNKLLVLFLVYWSIWFPAKSSLGGEGNKEKGRKKVGGKEGGREEGRMLLCLPQTVTLVVG